MATGRLGAVLVSSANTYTTIYTSPVNYFTVASVSICNQSAGTVTVRLAVAAGTTSGLTPGNGEFIEYAASIVPGGVLERNGIVMGGAAGQFQISAYCSAANAISVVVMGIETSTT
jgi:hypothetical protein